ncbi:putative 39S ribosomal protein L32, mitochondrial [Aphelenchoides besseyi]|nr:putative 39S ribosomal protein L32, mitochondrial [Aphelenchoides besseyi]KAI6195421.1 putative 39S ribosomal protein L32, mitochondrial [Aphelenchoides besseyi]
MRLSFLLFGVPKFRTSKPKILTRKFAYTRLLKPNPYIVECVECNSAHDVRTVCGVCYNVVREQTNAIKRNVLKLHQTNRAFYDS